MHTFNGKSCKIHHNGDFSGKVIILVRNFVEIDVDIEDLFEFVAEYIRSENINTLEQMDWEDILKTK